MAFQITLPNSAELGTMLTILRWLRQEGEDVKQGDPVAEVEADKGTLDVEAVVSGTLIKIVLREGAQAPPGGVIGYIGKQGEPVPGEELRKGARKEQEIPEKIGSPAGAMERPVAGVKATPAVRKLAMDLGVELSSVKGTGSAGIVTREDVLAAKNSAMRPRGR